ncbi:hypothetical protein [Paraburkholderia sp. PGU19]|nr:hypothetical protein [Paraburkholderia sp. PGU19]
MGGTWLEPIFRALHIAVPLRMLARAGIVRLASGGMRAKVGEKVE